MVIPISRPIDVNLDAFMSQVKSIYERRYLTNDGPCVKELENWFRNKFDINYCKLVSNGTHALEAALKLIEPGEIITTPFTFTATINAIYNAGHIPRFVDVKLNDGTIDENLVEQAINASTVAILGVHVYGNPCAVFELEKIAAKHKVKLIFDSSHALGASFHGKALISYGDLSATSLHATKVFNTCEGGLIYCKNKSYLDNISKISRFQNIEVNESYQIGNNYKMSELHAAWGLAQIDNFESARTTRKLNTSLIKTGLKSDKVRIFNRFCAQNFSSNFSYLALLLETDNLVIPLKDALLNIGIEARRYFYPSLDLIFPKAYTHSSISNSKDLSNRVLCVPNHTGITQNDLENITNIINSC